MTKITNKTTKVVGIAGQIVLPGETIEVSDEIANGEVVKHLCKIGKVSIQKAKAGKTDEEKAKAKAEAAAKKAAAEAVEKAKAEAEAKAAEGK